MSRLYYWVVGVVAGLGLGAFAHGELVTPTLAQSRPAERGSYPETRTWVLPTSTFNAVRVVDTAGVCLYVYMETIVAIPKTQLPPGTGCQ